MCGVRVTVIVSAKTVSFLVVQVKILNIICHRPFVFNGSKYNFSLYEILNLYCN